MKLYATGLVLLCSTILLTGCGPRGEVRTVRDLRLAGKADSAYIFVRSALEERPDRMDLWLEFARSALELSRITEEDEAQSRRYLLEAALACASMNKHRNQRLDREWRDIGRRVAAQVGRRVNRFSATMTSQSQNAEAFRQSAAKADSLRPRRPEDERLHRAVAQFQEGARELLYSAVVMRVLIESLPELSPGSAEMLSGQMKDAQFEWLAALELEDDFAERVSTQATNAIGQALQKSADDLDQLGYFLPSTIIENGVFP